MILKKHFICPGPTPIPHFSSIKLTNEVIHHRSDEFSHLYRKIIHHIQNIYQTQNDLFIINGSGTASMEAAVVNSLHSKFPVLIIRSGIFSERWGKICEAFKIPVLYFDIPYGRDINWELFENFLKEHSQIQAILSLYTETSTGALYDIKRIAQLGKKYTNALILIDAITAILVHPCLTDEWELDIVLSSSQKSYMTVPGLSFVSFSKKAWDAFYKSDLPKFYFNFEIAKENHLKGFTSWTPPVQIFYSIYENLEFISQFSLNQWFIHYSELAHLFRLGIKSLRLKIFPENPSNALTAVELPYSINPEHLVEMLYKNHKIKISLGYPKKGLSIIRIGHIGYTDISDLILFFQAFEIVLKKLDYNFELGISIEKIQIQIAESFKSH